MLLRWTIFPVGHDETLKEGEYTYRKIDPLFSRSRLYAHSWNATGDGEKVHLTINLGFILTL